MNLRFELQTPRRFLHKQRVTSLKITPAAQRVAALARRIGRPINPEKLELLSARVIGEALGVHGREATADELASIADSTLQDRIADLAAMHPQHFERSDPVAKLELANRLAAGKPSVARRGATPSKQPDVAAEIKRLEAEYGRRLSPDEKLRLAAGCFHLPEFQKSREPK